MGEARKGYFLAAPFSACPMSLDIGEGLQVRYNIVSAEL